MASLEQVIEKILKVFEQDGHDGITKDYRIGDVGDWYLSEFELIDELEEHFGASVPLVEQLSDDFFEDLTVKEYAELILPKINDQLDV